MLRTGETQSTQYWINLPALKTFKQLSALYPDHLDKDEDDL